MKMYFSPGEVGFYDEISNRPNDCTEISENQYQQLIAGLEAGKMLAADNNGLPVLTELLLTPEDEIALAEDKKNLLRSKADSEIAWLQDAAEEGIATESETLLLAEWKKYRVLLMRVDTAAPDWPTPPVEQAS